MSIWNCENTIFIMASTGYARKAIEKKGMRVFSPYWGNHMPLRIFREACFKLPFLPTALWYNKEILCGRYEYINIIDVNITSDYLKWIKRNYPKAQINFIYNNMVGKARNIVPEKIPEGIRVWTYDDYDARKYGIRLFNNYWIHEMIFKQRKKPEYDVFFVGRDKGRGENLLKLERRLQSMGLKTKFIITIDGKMAKKKLYYQKPLSYEEVIDYDTRSRAILNFTMENQEGVTMRDMESVAIGVKLITTNRSIVRKDLYAKNNVFILGVDNIGELPGFLALEYIDIWDDIKENHTFEAMLDEITGVNRGNLDLGKFVSDI